MTAERSSVVSSLVDLVASIAGVSRDEVVVEQAEAVVFPNGALGCEQPGMSYTQVQVEGYRVVLRAAGEVFDYRGTGSRPPRRCLPRG
jgi:hypothetical protein